MYGDTGYIYVMLYARYLAAQGKKVLVMDRSEGGSILARLPIPDEPIDCLFYQGVDYLIHPGQAIADYDLVLSFQELETDGKAAEEEGILDNSNTEVVFSDCDLLRLRHALDHVLKQNAVLVVTGVPEYGTVKRLLRRLDVCLPEAQLVELPWKSRDAQVILAQEYGMRMSVRKLSREAVRMLRYLSERTAEGGRTR